MRKVKTYNNVLRYIIVFTSYHPAGIYLFKVNNRNTRTRCEICSKLTINTPERRGDVLVYLLLTDPEFLYLNEHISHLVLVFLLLTLNK